MTNSAIVLAKSTATKVLSEHKILSHEHSWVSGRGRPSEPGPPGARARAHKVPHYGNAKTSVILLKFDSGNVCNAREKSAHGSTIGVAAGADPMDLRTTVLDPALRL